MSQCWNRLLPVGLLGAVLATDAAAQDLLYSTSGNADAAHGRLEDQEIGRWSAAGGHRPWLRTANGAFFFGDQDADGHDEEFGDVDALFVRAESGRVVEACLSLLADQDGLKDGDVLRLTMDGQLEVAYAESQIVNDFGINDGNVDVDALHVDADGTVWLSFADHELSSLLASDGGEIADGAILRWEPSTGAVAVAHSEAEIETMVGVALGTGPVGIGDLMSLSRRGDGAFHFSVQSPSDQDASVFSTTGGGQLEIAEADLAFSNQAELDALHLADGLDDFLGTHLPERIVPPATAWSIELDGAPQHSFWILFANVRGDAALMPGGGFHGLHLDPIDPLLSLSLSTPVLKGRTDDQGKAVVSLPPTPAGFSATLVGQVFDRDTRSYSPPFSVSLD